jgi:putative endonuclease
MDKSKNEKWCVYVLKCRGNFIYIGLTNNIDRRLKEHEKGTGSKFVRSRRPFELVKTISCKSAGEARRLEYSLKRLKRSRKIEALGLKIGPLNKKLSAISSQHSAKAKKI